MNTSKSLTLPKLPLEAWEQSKMTLHLYLQIVGKIQLALMPRKNHWWNITFLVNARGLVSHMMPAGDRTLEIQFNFIQHQVEIMTSDGGFETIPLRNGLSVAMFHEQLFSVLAKMGIEVKIIDHPYSFPNENPMTTPFSKLTQFNSYDPEYVHRYWQILLWIDEVFDEFSGRFYGKTCPVQLYWHSMDLAVTRFCGRRGPEMPPEANVSNRDAYSHEVISFGFWAGDAIVRGAAFYSYTYPPPEGLDQQPLKPSAAKWQLSNGSPMATLMYDDLLAENDPRDALLDFLESGYQAGARLAKWEIEDLIVPPLP